MLYCYFVAWFPVCSVQNSAEFLRRAPASARHIEVLHSCSGGLRTAGAGRNRHAAQWTWRKLTHRLKWKWNLSAPLAWWRRNAADKYPVPLTHPLTLHCAPPGERTPPFENHCHTANAAEVASRCLVLLSSETKTGMTDKLRKWWKTQNWVKHTVWKNMLSCCYRLPSWPHAWSSGGHYALQSKKAVTTQSAELRKITLKLSCCPAQVVVGWILDMWQFC